MKSQGNWLTILQLALSLLAAVIVFNLSAGFTLIGIADLAAHPANGSATDAASGFLWAAGLSLCGMLLLPSAYFALLRLLGQSPPRLLASHRLSIGVATLLLLLVALPASVATGWLAAKNIWSTMLVLPLMHVLAVSIPVLWLVIIGLRGLPSGSAQRVWGVFASGLVLGPGISISLELIAFILVAIVGVFALASNPEQARQFELLAEQIRQTADPEQALALMRPLLSNPWVVGGVFGFMAVVVPLIEETFKPIGVFLLIGRQLTAAGGFAAGLLSGAGFALFESLMVSASPDNWAAVVTVRAGTAAVHMLTTGLTGYGLASALSERRYLRLVVCYLVALLFHATWNALTIIFAGASLLETGATLSPTMEQLASVIPLILIGVAGLAFLCIVLINRRLSKKYEVC